jgi:Derlin-2/3
MAANIFWELPPVTRTYLACCLATTVLCGLDVLSPFHLYYNWLAIVSRGQTWRLFTTFCYFGNAGINFFLNMAFLLRYSKGLEEGYGPARMWDFAFCMCAGAAMLLLVAPFTDIIFFGTSLTSHLVYLWSRRNPGVQISLFFLITFSAPYLPWVLLGFSALLGHDVKQDLLGIAVGHAYFFLEDVWPALATARGWRATQVMPSPSNVAAAWRACCGGGQRRQGPGGVRLENRAE